MKTSARQKLCGQILSCTEVPSTAIEPLCTTLRHTMPMTLADRPFAPASNQHNLEQYTGNYKDSTFVPTEPRAKLTVLLVMAT